MCGIIGVFGDSPFKFVTSNIHFLARRGPDNQGIKRINNNLIFAAHRLAMVDPLPRSNQPLEEPVQKDVLIFNGEIYNYLEIKKDLISENIKFFSESDTEVLLKILSNYGTQAIEQLQGMFAFGFYNYKKNSIILARDYLGKKPLYYSVSDSYFIFASQINIIKKYIRNCNVDNLSLATYLQLGFSVSPKSIYSEIRSVEPGQILEFDLNDLSNISQQYFTPKSITNTSNLSLELLIENSIMERVVGHDKFALSLSGGIDSTILAVVSAKLGLKCETYTMRWPDSDKNTYNEDFKAAEVTANKLGLKFKSVEMPNTINLEAQLQNYCTAISEPNSNPSGLSMMQLYSIIASDGHRLVLTGDGADEIFGGYARYKLINSFPRFNRQLFSNLIDSNFSKFNLLKRIFLLTGSADSINFWLHWHELMNSNYIKKFMNNYNPGLITLPENELSKVIVSNKVSSTMLKDLKIWLTMESNVKLDQVSMHHSIEARSPFQSEKLIGAALKVMSVNDFKLLDKKILIDLYPNLKNFPILPVKRGFLSPLGHWLRNNPNLIFNSLNYLEKNFNFNRKELKKLSMSPWERDYKATRFLWNLIVLAQWHELNSYN